MADDRHVLAGDRLLLVRETVPDGPGPRAEGAGLVRGARPSVLDLTGGLAAAAGEVCRLVPDLAHVQLEAVHFTLFHSKTAHRTLTYARCYPLPATMKHRGRRWYALSPVYTPSGERARYLLAFAWPRFWTLPPRARLETLLHELYHIGPAFDGEARSFESGGWHGRGRAWFDALVHDLAEAHLPADLEWLHPCLALSLEDSPRVRGERLRRPRWEEALRSL